MVSMASALFRMLVAITVILMPLSMASAGAPLAAQDRAVESGQCDGHREPPGTPGEVDSHCGACIALPALTAPVAIAGLLPPRPVSIAAPTALLNPAPEVATPPPKAA
jgi:hypothetical protein